MRIKEMSAALADAAGVSTATSSLHVSQDAPYDFQLHFSFLTDAATAKSAQEKVALAIRTGVLPGSIGVQSWLSNTKMPPRGPHGP